MSGHITIKTLMFCTKEINILTEALKILDITYCVDRDIISLDILKIENSSGNFFVRVEEGDLTRKKLFESINQKAADLETKVRDLRIRENEKAKEKAKLDSELYRVRQIQKEQNILAYEKEKLELERESFIEAKKTNIVEKAKAMGYTIQERTENGVVRLKLIKRVY